MEASTMKYRDNMTEAELAAFMAEYNALDAALSECYEMEKHAECLPDEWEDEMETLRKAALNRGRP